MQSGKSTFIGVILYLAICSIATAQNGKQKLLDITPPVAVCDGSEQVSLTTIPTKVYAETFDDGSYDETCFSHFAVKRSGETDDFFKPYINFTCDDVASSPIKVVLRVYDCAGNYNDCWSNAYVEDKTKPVILCPNEITINCNEDVSKFWGTPTYFDNCGVVKLTYTISDQTDQCLSGYIYKNWVAKDQFNNSATCSQKIYMKHVNDYSVTFPNDVTITKCESPNDLKNTGEPVFMNKDCELVAVGHTDWDTYITSGDGCFVRIRVWQLINWCIYDPNLPNHTKLGIPQGGKKYKDDDGYFEYTQYIKVFENGKPKLTCKDTLVCLTSDCTADFTIPKPKVVDCSSTLTYEITGDLGTNFQVSKVPPGIYGINYNISDGCGNHSFCSTKVEVKDCKKPTPVVINGLSTTLMVQTGQVTVWASDFNKSSYDNCTPGNELTFSFSPDPNDKFKVFNCDSLGLRTLKIYTHDKAGNWDFAITTIDIQDNMNACDSSSTIVQIIGNAKKADGTSLSQVLVKSEKLSVESDSLGVFNSVMMKIPMPAQFAINKQGIASEDISILDIILLKDHILGIKKFENAYQYLAADVNKSKSLSNADIWQMKQVILGLQTSWANNSTWNFVNKASDYNPLQSIWNDKISEMVLTDDLPDSVKVELVGVKTGDISSQTKQVNSVLEVRSDINLGIKQSENQKSSLIYQGEKHLKGLQFALNINDVNLDFLEIKLNADQYFIEKKADENLLIILSDEEIQAGQELISWNKEIKYEPVLSKEIEALSIDQDYHISGIQLNDLFEKGVLVSVSEPYPAPANNNINFNVLSNNTEKINIEILDMQGRPVISFNKDIYKGSNNIQLPLDIPTGAYLASFIIANEKLVRKFYIIR